MTMSEKSLVLAHFVFVNTCGQVDFFDSGMGSIMDLIGPELSELSALELENLPYLTWVTL